MRRNHPSQFSKGFKGTVRSQKNKKAILLNHQKKQIVWRKKNRSIHPNFRYNTTGQQQQLTIIAYPLNCQMLNYQEYIQDEQHEKQSICCSLLTNYLIQNIQNIQDIQKSSKQSSSTHLPSKLSSSSYSPSSSSSSILREGQINTFSKMSQLIECSQFEKLMKAYKYELWKISQDQKRKWNKQYNKINNIYTDLVRACLAGNPPCATLILEYLFSISVQGSKQKINKGYKQDQWDNFVNTHLKNYRKQQQQFTFDYNQQLTRSKIEKTFKKEFSMPENFVRMFIYLYSRNILYKQLNQQLRSYDNYGNNNNPLSFGLSAILIQGVKVLLGPRINQIQTPKILYRGLPKPSYLRPNLDYYWAHFSSSSKVIQQAQKFSQSGQIIEIKPIRKDQCSKKINGLLWFIDFDWEFLKKQVKYKSQQEVLIMPGFYFRVVSRSIREDVRITQIEQISSREQQIIKNGQKNRNYVDVSERLNFTNLFTKIKQQQESKKSIKIRSIVKNLKIKTAILIKGVGSKFLDIILQQKHVTELIIQENNLSDIPQKIKNLVLLKTLKVHKNNLSQLPQNLGSLQYLKQLYIRNNRLDVLPQSLSKLQNLLVLNLQNNQLSQLNNLYFKTLQELNLNYNCFVSFPNIIWQSQTLEKIQVANNRLTSLGQGIIQMAHLTYFDFSNNNIQQFSEEFYNFISIGLIQEYVNLQIIYEGNPLKDKEQEKLKLSMIDDEQLQK